MLNNYLETHPWLYSKNHLARFQEIPRNEKLAAQDFEDFLQMSHEVQNIQSLHLQISCLGRLCLNYLSF